MFRFDPALRSLGGSITLLADPYSRTGIAFGDGVDGNAQDGASAYIDDDTFAAAGNPNGERSFFGLLGGDTFLQREGQAAATYVVSGSGADLAALGVAPEYRCSTCDFLKWGWWGTQLQLAEPSDPATEARRLSVHMGTWVAGDIADVAQIDTLSSSTGTYQGAAVGTVVSGTDSYLAAGQMDMTYSFGSREGTLTISDFDGRNVSGSMSGSVSGQATFAGALAGSPHLAGNASGAFVNNGGDVAAGAIGNFDMLEIDSDWRASGIFAGGRLAPTQ
jgi:hypothetical protein